MTENAKITNRDEVIEKVLKWEKQEVRRKRKKKTTKKTTKTTTQTNKKRKEATSNINDDKQIETIFRKHVKTSFAKIDSNRLNRALQQKITILESKIDVGFYKFRILGTQGKTYRVRFEPNKTSCSCPDATNHICKHLMLVLAKVFKEPQDSVLYTSNNICKEDFERLGLQREFYCAEKVAKRRDYKEDDECCICCDELGKEPLVFCKSTCGNNFHKLCMQKCLKVQRLCPICRQEWNE
jgi:hypothetical protein